MFTSGRAWVRRHNERRRARLHSTRGVLDRRVRNRVRLAERRAASARFELALLRQRSGPGWPDRFVS